MGNESGRDSKGAYNESGQYVKTSRDGQYFSAYSSDPSKPNHERLTIKTDEETGKFSYSYHNEDKSEKSEGSGNCYLTSACMRFFGEKFDDNCNELTILRWFRDNFVSKEDIDHYYQTAPTIVTAIDSDSNKNIIYDYIYENVIHTCIEAIKNGDYNFAYNKYKESILSLEETFARKEIQGRLIKSLKNSNIC